MSIQTRMTRQRAVILETLRSVCTHPTADEVYTMVKRRMPRISLGTVYRNLDFLAANNDIMKLESGGTTRRFDGTTAPHSHVRCTSCGRVADVHGDTPPLPMQAVHAEGFTLTGARVEYDGVCDVCAVAVQ